MTEKTLTVASERLPMATMSPRQEINAAAEAANALQEIVERCGLSREFGGKKKYLVFEAWQTIGSFYNCTPLTEWTKPIWHNEKIVGWEARVQVIDGESRIIGAAESMCAKDEPNWRDKPQYALRSMAQTRAAGKALRSVFARVAVLAGFAATPAEEMDDSFSNGSPKSRTINKPLPVNAQAKENNEVPPEAATGNDKGESSEMTPKQDAAIRNLMLKKTKLTKEEAQVFYNFVLEDGLPTKKWAGDFISNFDKYYNLYQEQMK